MKLTRRYVLGASGAFLGACLIRPAYSQLSATKTIGSWTVSGKCNHADAWLIDSAIAFASGAVGRPPAQMHYSASLKLGCNPNGTFGGSLVQVSPGADVPAFLTGIPLPTAVIADDKEVGRFDARKPIDLSTVFGADLAKLAPVRTLEIAVVPMAGGVMTIFKASLDQTAAALQFMRTIALSSGEKETVGSWNLSAWNGDATAVVDRSAIVTDIPLAGGDKLLRPGHAQLWLEWRPDLRFDNEYLFCILDLPAKHEKDAAVRLVADGKEVQRTTEHFPFSGSDPKYKGLQSFQLELTKAFGKDLKGLVPIGNIKAILSLGDADTTIYEANLSKTADALEQMIVMARVSARECAAPRRVPIRRRRH
jgi:hypothetical protein